MYWTEREYGQEQRLKRRDFIKGGLEELSLEPPVPDDFDPDLYDPDADPEIEEEEGE